MEPVEHADGALQLVVRLVNALTPGWRGGQQVGVPGGAGLRQVVAEALADRPNRARAWAAADGAQHDLLRGLAVRWRAVVDAAAAGDADAAAAVNALLDDAPVAPVLVDHDDQPWHLHAHRRDAPPAAALAATAALAFARLVAAGDTTRVGTCRASACDRVYVDMSRNGSRRYCSGTCQARSKTAAYRARREAVTS